MNRKIRTTLATGVLLLACGAVAQEHQHDMSQHAEHEKEMNARGEKAMGFSQMATTHHFILLSDGGYVQVTANDASDNNTVEQIRRHLMDIKTKFAAGDFSAPELTHGKIPPGVPAMRKLRGDIKYNVEFVDGGGRLHIASNNAKAIAAIHDFLKFQIEDHGTGDPTATKD
ncbi:MAG: hypothetical protein ACRD3E_16300 [Terriglobales bacterium]